MWALDPVALRHQTGPCHITATTDTLQVSTVIPIWPHGFAQDLSGDRTSCAITQIGVSIYVDLSFLESAAVTVPGRENADEC